MNDDRIISAKEAAELLGVGVGRVQRYAKDGVIPHMKYPDVLRFSLAELTALRESVTIRPRGIKPKKPKQKSDFEKACEQAKRDLAINHGIYIK